MDQETWLTLIGIKDDETKSKLEKICEDTQETAVSKGETFKYSFLRSKFPKYKHVLLIESESKDQAMKRGCWFVHKTGILGLLFWTKQKGGI